MTIRTRKFFGTIALLLLVVVWSLLGMTVAQSGSRHRLGIAGDADHQLDVAARRLGTFSARMLR
jgi:hypothetical protein